MTAHLSAEENKLIELLKKLPLDEKDRSAFVDAITASGLSEELIKEIRAKTTNLTQTDDAAHNTLTQNITTMNQQMQRWRLNRNLRHAGRH
jgi:hypothetical protein